MDRKINKMNLERNGYELTRKIFYFDENGNITDREHAKTFIINFYDENGNRVQEMFGSFDEDDFFD